MTSSKDMKAGSVLQSSGEERRRAPLDQLPPPANSNKPLTPFSIEDILNKPSVKKSVASICPPRVLEKVTGSNSARNGITTPSSPLCALEELASKTFKGLEVSVIQAAEEARQHGQHRGVAGWGPRCQVAQCLPHLARTPGLPTVSLLVQRPNHG
ncbi:hypothetical protein FQN60_009956 [Etheostoma spectabile]|uniref:Uncharacterized protein n=1 Tax=Etheostoma spectabile TaxID=54343 RepID=A0A5J5DAD1_9PERO|nr:hypothetical protein FQN60_009956 [Etheostoma spectabile]